jgi:hypothetical protein
MSSVMFAVTPEVLCYLHNYIPYHPVVTEILHRVLHLQERGQYTVVCLALGHMGMHYQTDLGGDVCVSWFEAVRDKMNGPIPRATNCKL